MSFRCSNFCGSLSTAFSLLSLLLSVGVGLLQSFRAVWAGRGEQRELAQGTSTASIRARTTQSAAGSMPSEFLSFVFFLFLLILQIPMVYYRHLLITSYENLLVAVCEAYYWWFCPFLSCCMFEVFGSFFMSVFPHASVCHSCFL